MSGPRWTVEFKEDGGYDCTSAAYVISADGRPLMKVDVADFVRESVRGCDDETRYRIMHAHDEGAQNLAQFIVNALNLHGR